MKLRPHGSAFIEKQTNLNYRIQDHNKSCAAGLADLSPRMSENKGQKAGDHEQQGGGHVGKIEHDQRGHGEMNPGQVFYDHKDPRGQSHCQEKTPDSTGQRHPAVTQSFIHHGGGEHVASDAQQQASGKNVDIDVDEKIA